MTTATSTPDLRAVVRYAIECAGLAAWCAGLDLSEYLWPAAEAADRGDFDAAAIAAFGAFRASRTDGGLCAHASCAAARASLAADRGDYAAANAAARAAFYAADAAAYAAYAAFYAAFYAADAAAASARARALLIPDAPDARALRTRVAEHIAAHPETHDPSTWGTGAPECGTAQCAAGWICSLGGGTRGLPVELVARALSHVDGAERVVFDPDASRGEVLASLRVPEDD